MLTNLSIRDVVLIDKLDVDFAEGLCVLTGETGAGKSIVLDALGLALGGRSEAGLIRSGADKLTVSAAFILPRRHPAFAVLTEQDIAAEDDQLVLRRVVGRDGRGRAFVNDQPVSVGLLRTLGDLLVEVHGQFETHGLLDPTSHIAVLDDYRRSKSGDKTDKACVETYQAWHAASKALTDAQETLATALKEEDMLRHAVSELETLSPKPGEEAELAGKRNVLRHAEQILKAMEEARAAVSEAVDVEGALRTAQTKLTRAAAQAGGRLDAAVQAFDRAAIETAEAVGELEKAFAGFDADPKVLERAEERLFALKAAARKYNCPVDDLAVALDRFKAQLSAVDNGADAVKKLAAAEKAAKLAYEQAARALSTARTEAAKELDKRVAKELPPLKLDKAKFHTVVAPQPDTSWNESGLDRVTFEVATNPGSAPGPLNKIASGGELSRFMLALRVVLAGSQSRASLVFDEVDAGISGATANAVGERLARLAKDVQVLVITHSPQVAARGAHHWRVAKATKAGQTTTRLEQLSTAARREEIARMLAGADVTDEARAAADSLMSAPPQ